MIATSSGRSRLTRCLVLRPSRAGPVNPGSSGWPFWGARGAFRTRLVVLAPAIGIGGSVRRTRAGSRPMTRAKTEHGEDAGAKPYANTARPEDAARRRFAAASGGGEELLGVTSRARVGAVR